MFAFNLLEKLKEFYESKENGVFLLDLFQGLKKDSTQILRNIMLNKSTFVDTEKTQNLINLEPRIVDWGQSMIGGGGGDLDNESVYSERH